MNRYIYDNDDQPDQVKIQCTDNDKVIDAEIVSRKDHNIVMTIYDKQVRLSFIRHKFKPNIWIANREGYEFVYQLK